MEERSDDQMKEAETEVKPVVLDAGHVYLLMEDEFRISRNARAAWYLQHLGTTITPRQVAFEQNDVSDELKKIEVLSVSTRAILPQDKGEEQECVYKVVPNTTVTFLAKKYRFVFILDLSPSVASVDVSSSQVLYDEIFCGFRNTLRGLISPFCLSGSDVILKPQIFVTVIAHTPLISCKSNQVLIQGCLVYEDNIEALLELLRSKLDLFENAMAAQMLELVDGDLDDGSEDMKLTGGLFEDIIERPESPDMNLYLMTPDISFINMLRHGILALQLLPENSSAGIVVVTDGVIGLPEASLFESLMTQLRHNTIAVSFVPVGNGYHIDAGLGQVRYTALMQFLAAATFGAYLISPKEVPEDNGLKMTVYQQGLLTWSFQKALGGAKLDTGALTAMEALNEDMAWASRLPLFRSDDKRKKATPMTSKKHQDKPLNTSISNLISCRLREGYTIKDIALTKGETQIEVLLVLPWRDNVFINYLAVSTWPLNTAKRHTRVELTIEGSYDFLHDVTCPVKKPVRSPYRTALVKQYWQTLQGMTETDRMLVHLQSFYTNSFFYTVPEGVQQGVPLFYLPPNSTVPQINIQQGSKDGAINQFASFWKLVLSLDPNFWQKWMHTHRIGMILEHDTPLGKHLHTPNSSGRFHSVTCRQALTSLNFFLMDWSTFVLMENHSYIKLIYSDPDKPPTSFFVLRVASKPPCLVLRLAFLGGTPGKQRKELVKELQVKIAKLTFPQRVTQKEDKIKVVRKTSGQEGALDVDPEHRPPLQRLWADIQCCILMQKPIEKILVRYERMPHDFLTLDAPMPMEQPYQMGQVLTANRVGSNIFSTLARYLHHQRWVWAVQHGPESISVQAAGRILSTLTKIRLQEGFHFANASSGIISMAVEVELKNPDFNDVEDDLPEGKRSSSESSTESGSSIYPCVVQYVIFPPHTNTSRETMSDDDLDEMPTAEADGELQIVTECWVEPQYGIVCNSTPERKQLDGLDFKQLPQALFPTDIECISTMLTFEHLNTMCQKDHIPSPFMLGGYQPPSRLRQESCVLPPQTRPEASIQPVPFAFDLLRLLPKCQQVELLFSTFMQDVSPASMPRLRSETLTQDNLGSTHQNFESANTPNDRLFSLFLDSMQALHERELHLTDTECEQLVGLVRQRERDLSQHPLPFVVDEPTLADDDLGSESTVSIATNYSSGTAPISCSMSTSSLRNMPRSSISHSYLQRRVSTGSPLRTVTKLQSVKSDTDINKHSKVLGRRASERIAEIPSSILENLSPISSVSDRKRSLNKSDVENMPRLVARWRCFVKSVSGSHLLLCLVPASYSDLRLLVQGQVIMHHQHHDEEAGEKDKFVSVDGVEHVENVTAPTSPIHSPRRKHLSAGTHSDCSSPRRRVSIDLSECSPKSHHDEMSSRLHMAMRSHSDVTVCPQAPDATDQPDTCPSAGVAAESDVAECDQERETCMDGPSESLEEPTTADSDTPCPVPPMGLKSLPIPVYIYSCPLSSLTDQLVNKWTYCKPPDVYQDLTVKTEPHETSHSDSRAESVERSPRRRTESEHIMELMRLSRDEPEQDELTEHCTLVSEHFFRNFVTGLYHSLLENQSIVCGDVDAAINGICEESLPLEVDISRFTQCVCGHVRSLLEKAHGDDMRNMMIDEAEKDPFNRGSPMHEMDCFKGRVDENILTLAVLSPEYSGNLGQYHTCWCPVDIRRQHTNSLVRGKTGLGVEELQPPPSPSVITLPISVLDDEEPCESQSGLHQLIRDKFRAIMHTDFKPVPSNEDFFIYCPSPFRRESRSRDTDILGMSDKSGQLANLSSEQGNMASGEESDVNFASDDDGAVEHDAEHGSLMSDKESASLSSGDEDIEAAEDLANKDGGDEDVPSPLFIYLMCSVRVPGCPLKSVPIRNLPTCLKELHQCLSDLGPEVDINAMRVTLDVICLTLPPEADLAEPSKRPCFKRMTSFTSHLSVCSSPTEFEAEDHTEVFSLMTTEGGYPTMGTVSDPLQGLPKRQQEAVRACKEQLQWLLQDEIASAMRLLTPVTPETLDMVAMHVKTSVDKPRCIAKEVRLQFVYGPDRSLQPFIENFERMSLPGYHLLKEAGYYYLYLDRVLAAFSAAMQNISSPNGKGVPFSPANTKDSPLSPPCSKESPLTLSQSKDSPLLSSYSKDSCSPSQPKDLLSQAAHHKESGSCSKEDMHPVSAGSEESGASVGKDLPASAQRSKEAPAGTEAGQPHPDATSNEEASEHLVSESQESVSQNVNKDSSELVDPLSLKDSNDDVSEVDNRMSGNEKQIEEVSVLRVDLSAAAPQETVCLHHELEESVELNNEIAARMEDTTGSTPVSAEVSDPDLETNPLAPVEGTLTEKAFDGVEVGVEPEEIENIELEVMSVDPKQSSDSAVESDTLSSPADPSKTPGSLSAYKDSVIVPQGAELSQTTPTQESAVTPGMDAVGPGGASGAPASTPDEPDAHPLDNSVEILLGEREGSSFERSGEEDSFRPEDIRISVIRPSPVKEAPRKESDGEKEDADISENTSGSSIQVLDDTPVTMTDDGAPSECTLEDLELRTLTSRSLEEHSPLQGKPSKESSPKDQAKNRRSSLPEGHTHDFLHQSKSEVCTSGSHSVRQLSPISVLPEGDKKAIKRVHSSASFEKYKAQNVGKRGSKSGRVTPQKSSDQTTPNRSRHHSGLQTPQSGSVMGISSRSSVGEEGYEGDSDSSEGEEEDAMLSFTDLATKGPLLPHFWLIMKIVTDRVDVFFHTRDTGAVDSEEFEEQQQLYDRVINNISDVCRTVNQHLLLQDLNDTHICNKLLVPEADEDVHWSLDKHFSTSRRRRLEGPDSDDSDTDLAQDEYLAATLHFMPGYFACNAVWQTEMVLHPRLKAVSGKTRSRGIQAVLSVLDTFSVTNRKNMFVIKETNGEVFYLRLEEHQGDSLRHMSLTESFNFSENRRWDEDVTSMASRSSSILSLPTTKKEPDDDSGNLPSPRRVSQDRDDETVSMGTARSFKKPSDVIVLTVHGINEVGLEIRDDLMQLLQKKLDDAVLDILTVTLARNNMSKLTPEDVMFIQPPGCASRVIRLTIPGSAMLHQFALGYYLRQNLLQFLYTPKYADPRQEAVFRDVTQAKAPVIPENQVFLYNRPQQAGGKGVACLQLTFVDGRGNPVTLLSSPRPSPFAYCDILEKSQFESAVTTQLYHVKEGARLPETFGSSEPVESTDPSWDGPTALVQFTIWERGDVGMKQMTERLLLAMKQALADLVTEYRLLTAPICEVPPQLYTKEAESLAVSTPSSPMLTAGMIPEPRSLPQPVHAQVKKQLSGDSSGTRTPKEKSGLNLFFRSKAPKDTSKPVGSPIPAALTQMSPSPGESLTTQKERDLREKISKYEAGERGHLQETHQNCLQDWFHFCNTLNVPAMQSHRFELSSRFSIDYVLHDFQNTVVRSVAPDTTLREFLRIIHNDDIVYLPYTPSRAPVQTQEARLESSLDQPRETGIDVLPGQPRHFIVVGRSLKQWRMSVDFNTAEEESVPTDVPAARKGRKSSQKFISLDPALFTSSEKGEGLPLPSTPGHTPSTPLPASSASMGYGVNAGSYADNPEVYVPRQKFLLMTVTDKVFQLFTYNWANEHHTSMVSQLSRLIQWHNARTHLLACLLSQKAGLFQHRLFGQLSPDPGSQEANPFVGAAVEHDLVRYLRPPNQFRSGSISQSLAGGARPGLRLPPIPCLEDVYRDCHPRRPLHLAQSRQYQDPVVRHGRQMLELRRQERIENEKRHKLEQLYMMWQQRMGTHMPIGEDVLEHLKTSSRLVHCVATPVLFSPAWRRVVIGKEQASTLKRKPSQTSIDSRPRSRHSSGTSVRSKRSDSQDGKRRTASGNSNMTDPAEAVMKNPVEEAWHQDLRNAFTSQYVQYLQSLGFIQINTCPATLNSRPAYLKPTVVDKSNSNPKKRQIINPAYTYLQKTLPGGIMLIELGFKEVYFCIHVYTFECSRLPVGKTVNPQLALIFTDECDKFKDLTHAHSFAYDFHLRMVQVYVAGRQLVFRHGYHLTAFLNDFIQQYPCVPSFSRNFVYEAELTVENTNSPGHQLFDYMLNHDKTYGMRAVRMNPIVEEEGPLDLGNSFAVVSHTEEEAVVKEFLTLKLQDSDYALVMQYPCDARSEDYESAKLRPQDYNIGLVVTHEGPGSLRFTDSERNQLRLKFYVLLTSKTDLFPKHTLEKKLGVFKAASCQSFPAKARFRASGLSHNVDGDLQLLKQAGTDDEDSDGGEGLLSDVQPVPGRRQSISECMAAAHMDAQSWPESINYLGYSNKQQAAGYALLQKQVELARVKIQEMVASAMLQCRRDLLWQRMLLSQAMADDDTRRKRRSEKVGDADDLLMVRPSFSEFEEMLGLVTRVSLDVMDPRLSPLLTMSVVWYQGLARILMTKYSEHHRAFTSPDGRMQYVVVLNPKYLDAFMLLEVDLIAHKADLCAIYREPLPEGDSQGSPHLTSIALQEHLEGVVNACCFHMWSGFL